METQNYKTRLSETLKRIEDEILKDGGFGLGAEENLVGYDPLTETNIYLKDLELISKDRKYLD